MNKPQTLHTKAGIKTVSLVYVGAAVKWRCLAHFENTDFKDMNVIEIYSNR